MNYNNYFFDDATNQPINFCCICQKEVVGWVDNPEENFCCGECKNGTN